MCFSADFRLEETSQDLQRTKEKLSQEEFICSELTSVQENLFSAAGQVKTLRHTRLQLPENSLML